MAIHEEVHNAYSKVKSGVAEPQLLLDLQCPLHKVLPLVQLGGLASVSAMDFNLRY